MVLKRPAPGLLRPYVECLWAVDETCNRPASAYREHVLPSGQMHLAFRLQDHPLRLFAHAGDVEGRVVGCAVIGGARDTFYAREVPGPLCSVGAQLRPGAAEALFGVAADELAGRHTALEDLWGSRVASMRDRLAATGTLEERIDALAAMLTARLARPRALHPAVASALEHLIRTTEVHAVVKAGGYSHRTLVTLFRRSVGLTPKRYSRVLRFQRALKALSSPGPLSLADLASA